jgi:hypothetical protein
MPTFLPIGLGAGLAAAVLFASASTGPLVTRFLLFFLASLPAFLAGLGWGWMAALVAALAGTFLAALISGPFAAMVYGLSQGLPVVVLCYLAYLNRPSPEASDGAVEWYPVGRLVIWAAVMAGSLSVLSLAILGSDMEALRTGLRSFIERTLARDMPQLGAKPLEPAQIEALTDIALYLLPAASAVSWLSGLLLNLWLAGRITLASGRLLRPWPDLAALSFPPGTTLALAAAAAATLISGFVGLAAAGVVGALFMAYILLGLSIVHYVTRGKPSRPFVLASVYTALVFLNPWSGLGLVLLALTEPFAPWRRRPPPSPGGSST